MTEIPQLNAIRGIQNGNFFGQLSQGQKDTMDKIRMIQGDALPISVNANGTTVTLQTAIGDDRNSYLKLQITAQEGKVLAIPGSGTLEILEAIYYEDPESIGLLSNKQGQRQYCYCDLTWLDAVPGDNQLELIMELSVPVDSAVSFIDDQPEVLTIPGLWSRTSSGEYMQLLKGPWVIELGKFGGQFFGLKVKGNTATYTTDGQTHQLLLESMQMSQLGIEVRGSFTDGSWDGANYSYPEPLVVMKDKAVFSSHLYTGDGHNAGNGELTETDCTFCVKFDAPLDLTQVDHVRIGDLVIPFSKDGSVSVDSSGYSQENLVLGTHITLGQPNSLRSSETIARLEDIGTRGAGSITGADWRKAWSYAEHTQQGVRLAHISSEFKSGKLVYTITDAHVITNINDLSTKKDGFSREACLYLDSNNEWQKADRPACIREDGSFEEGWYLVTVDLLVRNDDAAVTGENPYLFNAQSLLTLADLRHKTVGNYRCTNIDYFSGLNDYPKGQFAFCLEPGEEKSFTIGYLIRVTPDASGNPDLSAFRACTTTGGERSTFVDLKLEEKAEN